MDKGKDFLIGFILGAVVGATTALLFAPQSGAETRKILAERSQEVWSKTEQTLQDLKAKTEKTLQELKKSVDTLKAKLGEKTAQTPTSEGTPEGTGEIA